MCSCSWGFMHMILWLSLLWYVRESTQRRSVYAVNTGPDMERRFVKSSRRWKWHNMLHMDAHSAARMRKFCQWITSIPYIDNQSLLNVCLCRVKRLATGIWKCNRCKKVMAGGAYVLRYSILCVIITSGSNSLIWIYRPISTSAAVTVRTAIARLRKTKGIDV
jgi:hypothetical protein